MKKDKNYYEKMNGPTQPNPILYMKVDKNFVKEMKAELDERRRFAQFELSKITAEIKSLQDMCTHPNKRDYFAMGDYCPDCGYQT